MELPTYMEKSKKEPYKYCIVPSCRNTTRSAPDKVFFCGPRDADQKRKWCKIMNRDMVSPSTSFYCCEDHFNVEDMEYKMMNLQEIEKSTLRLKKGVLPHKFECEKDNQLQLPPVRKDFLKRKYLEIIEGAPCALPAEQSVSSSESNLEAATSLSSSHIHIEKENNLHINKAIQVNSKIYKRSKSVNVNLCAKTKNAGVSPISIPSKMTSTSPLKIAQPPGIKIKLFEDNTDVASKSSDQPSQLSFSSFEPDDTGSETSWIEDDSERESQFKNQMRSCMLTAIENEPKMLIGLPKRCYYLIKLLSENIPLHTIDILITLKKIKLNESFSILALQFGYTQSTISRIFSKSVLLLAGKMKDLIVWPAPVDIFNNLPIPFRARYSNVVSIIDCLEIQIEKPSNAVHQSLTWSQYKKCNTLKYLISCTPDGLVNFISNGYSGRATDVMIVEDCGYLECLPSKTAVMADRGFKDLSYLLGKKDCTLIRPPSVYKSTPSSKEDVKQSKRIAALRIHVERVINRLREFAMLLPHACVDHNLLSIIDEVIIVACGLINMQDVLIKK
ncbi:uncharacterized protein LOC119691085 [Plutella xylostella]|uniref:uncharacterized protein LOC119691085 n=1 Tax=Plutella xylostella TaxID=51655 RepID=UPI002032CD42|nr:uncharacterized protein LOC119691085 [Plutella xylostella]